MRRKSVGLVSDFSSLQKKGFGAGSFSTFKPWIDVKSSTSKACRYRIFLARTGRLHHFLSAGELAFCLLQDWDENVVEIREQVPLAPILTQAICQEFSIRHPRTPQGEVVMSSDFLIKRLCPDHSVKLHAYQIKRSEEDASRPRTAEKIRIEEEYWKRKGIPFLVVYSCGFNRVLIDNLQFLQGWRLKRSEENAKRAKQASQSCRSVFSAFSPSVLIRDVFHQICSRSLIEDFRTAAANKEILGPLEAKPLLEWRIGDLTC